jgi:hypothetical protein
MEGFEIIGSDVLDLQRARTNGIKKSDMKKPLNN